MALEQSQESPAPLQPAAFARLYDECLPRVYAYVGCRVEDRAAAEEVTASTFRRAVEVARQERLDPAAFVDFVFRVAATAVVDHARRTSGTFPRGIRAGDFDRATDSRRGAESQTEGVAARAYAAAMDRRALRRAMERLSDAQRRLIVLHYLDGLPVDEQCAVLGWSRETYGRRFNGALRALHVALAEETTSAA
jgi:RNA polymerase sigma factor (sigma-70 family)